MSDGGRPVESCAWLAKVALAKMDVPVVDPEEGV
jgi:hypothetical protein